MIGAFGLLAVGFGAYALGRLRKRYGAALVLLGLALVGVEVEARLRPAPPPPAAATHQVELEQRAALEVQVAQSELRAAGFALPRTGDAGSGVVVVDGEFTARITPSCESFRVERTGHPPIEGVTLPEAVAKILEAHTPQR